MADLHRAISTKLDDLERLANTAGLDSGSKKWVPRMMGGAPPEVAEHIATWDPATVLRGLAEDRDILARHAPSDDVEPNSSACMYCMGGPWANCAEIRSLARRHGVEVDGG